DGERGAGVAAGCAAVGAEMPDVGRLVRVRRTAADAVLRVRRVLERGTRMARVVEAEPEGLLAPVRERRDERVVGAHDERRVGCELSGRGAPALGDVLELAVPVELVAEEARQADHAWLRAAHDLRQREL